MENWQPVSKISFITLLILSIAFIAHAVSDSDGFLILDYINLPFHEFGHLFFGLFGEGIGIWGGTITQLAIPLIIFLTFFVKREPAGTAFSAFWFGENLLNIAVYIADARKMVLPLVGGGEHDWNIILSWLNMLRHDTVIASAVKISGWIIMIGSVLWFVLQNVRIRIAERYERNMIKSSSEKQKDLF